VSVQSQLGDQVRFVGVPGLADNAEMSEFLSKHGVSGFPHVPDPTAEIWRRFGVTSQHTYVFINDDGSWRKAGYGNLLGDVQGLVNS